MLRLSTLIAKGTDQYSLGWKQAGRNADGRRPDDGTPTFAEMAAPGVVFEGNWRENAFLNGEEVRKALRWNKPVTHETLFDAANQYAAKQLELHARYAEWTSLEALHTSVSELQTRLEAARNTGTCLLAIGWGAGFLSKSAAIGMDDTDHPLPQDSAHRISEKQTGHAARLGGSRRRVGCGVCPEYRGW
jgi:hypothetical protein